MNKIPIQPINKVKIKILHYGDLDADKYKLNVKMLNIIETLKIDNIYRIKIYPINSLYKRKYRSQMVVNSYYIRTQQKTITSRKIFLNINKDNYNKAKIIIT